MNEGMDEACPQCQSGSRPARTGFGPCLAQIIFYTCSCHRCMQCHSGGRQASLPGAIVCGFAAGTVCTLDDKLQPIKIAKQWLAENDLIDLDTSGKAHSAVAAYSILLVLAERFLDLCIANRIQFHPVILPTARISLLTKRERKAYLSDCLVANWGICCCRGAAKEREMATNQMP